LSEPRPFPVVLDLLEGVVEHEGLPAGRHVIEAPRGQLGLGFAQVHFGRLPCAFCDHGTLSFILICARVADFTISCKRSRRFSFAVSSSFSPASHCSRSTCSSRSRTRRSRRLPRARTSKMRLSGSAYRS